MHDVWSVSGGHGAQPCALFDESSGAFAHPTAQNGYALLRSGANSGAGTGSRSLVE